MKFGQAEIPQHLFELARTHMRAATTFETAGVRQHILDNAKADLAAINDLERNWPLIAERVTRACLNELRAAGEVEQVKKGVWKRGPKKIA
ncbi:hypothetical protein KTD31_01495 [Burkholderia multivorans]|uniref:hypothetical protein n=1 Tax=Burkholderia multivorans TaxID=87883 RepID=UPI001C212526|nr:hypothetical protein [Burkholderia multivorans]MBU9200076.1 hypothetical protein [Burkholderia multivorans]